MDPKTELNKFFKDLQDSAREFAHFGLQMGSKALDKTASTLTSLRDELGKTAERFAAKDGEAAPAEEATDEPSPQQ